MRKVALPLSILLLMCGCGHDVESKIVTVAISPANPASIDQGQSMQLMAQVAGYAANASQGVTWSISGAGCSGTSCGTLPSVTLTSATYQAPASVSAPLAVTVTAASVAESSETAIAVFYVTPPPSIVTINLPTATPNQPYSTTLHGTGGVQPLNWSLASGALPAGLSLNSEGTIYGTPTTGGTSTFTLKVTDSSAASSGPMSTEQTFSLSVVSVLSIPNATFPNGTVGTAYSATLPSTGGLVPLTWAMYSGSLPPGLVMQTNTGVISGTPTTQGTYLFSVEVRDSSPIQQWYISSSFSITINPSGPLTLRTAALMDGVVDVAYQAGLVATGGSVPYDWSVTTGALPSGLTLNSTKGAITGVPTAAPGNYSFTVEVSDASSPRQTSSQQLSITLNPTAVACSSSGNDSVLTGQYAFSLRGFNGTGFLAVVGSFTADGEGNITAGEADTNGVLGPQTGNIITSASSYSVGPDRRGCATLATPFGTFSTRFVIADLVSGFATQGRIIEFDNPDASAYIAAGQIVQQDSTAFVSPLTGSYGIQTSGWDPATSGRVACIGIVTASKYVFSYLEQDCNDNGTVTNTVNTGATSTTHTTVNTYGTADNNGRGTGIIMVGTSISDITFYWVTSSQLFMVNSDPGLVFSGDWQQSSPPLGSSAFSQTSFDGNVVSYSSGLAAAGATGDVSIATESADGTSSVSTQLYRDIAGAWQTASTTCTYAVVAIGRVILNGANCGANPPIYYLHGLNSAFALGTNSSVELGTFEPQTTGLTNASVAGTYFLGASEVVGQAAQAEVSIVTFAGNGTLTSTSDTASTASLAAGTAGSDTYTLNSDGTFSTGSSGGVTVGIAISGSKFVIVNNPTLTFPTLQVGQQ